MIYFRLNSRLTRLKGDSIVLLTEMFLSRFYDLREVEHRDGRGGIRLRHLTGQSTGASWVLFKQNNVKRRIHCVKCEITEWTFHQLIWETKDYSVSVFDHFHVVKCKQECFLSPPRSIILWKEERLNAVTMSCPSRTQEEFIRPMNFSISSSDLVGINRTKRFNTAERYIKN